MINKPVYIGVFSFFVGLWFRSLFSKKKPESKKFLSDSPEKSFDIYDYKDLYKNDVELMNNLTPNNKNVENITNDIKDKTFLYFIFDTTKEQENILGENNNKITQFDYLKSFVDIIIASKKDVEILLKIESFGGKVSDYELAYTNIMRLREAGYNITCLIDYYCCSGGYMLACACNKIICSEYANVGSMGVIASLFNYNEIMKKIGIENITVTTGRYKQLFPTMSEYDEHDENIIKEHIHETYAEFYDIVKKGRNLTDDEMLPIQEAKVYIGKKAQIYKMVDEVMPSTTYLNTLVQTNKVYLFHPSCVKTSNFYLDFISKLFVNYSDSLLAKIETKIQTKNLQNTQNIKSNLYLQ